MARMPPQMLPLQTRGSTNIDSMRDEVAASIQNNFTGGLKTEYTGLNFPHNACTDVDNVIFTLQADAVRRQGFDYETNFTYQTIDRTGEAISEYRWLNAGGDGQTQLYVLQVGNSLYFYKTSAATVASPMSANKLMATVNISNFLASGSSKDPSTVECQFSDGNGYLFVYHPYCDTFYCTYDPGTDGIVGFAIDVQIRDFTGLQESQGNLIRPPDLTAEHNYNLQNQGWSNTPNWAASGPQTVIIPNSVYGSFSFPLGNLTTTVAAGITGTIVGEPIVVSIPASGLTSLPAFFSLNITGLGTLVSYSGTTMVVNITHTSSFSASPYVLDATSVGQITINPAPTTTYITQWHTAEGNYPSNADVWWTFKDSTGVFAPGSTAANIPQSTAPASKGHFILDAFNQNPGAVAGISGLTPVITSIRPRTGTWFQGRVWYTGVDSSQIVTGDQQYYTWTENIYFSQIVTTAAEFGLCYQTDDPTDDKLFDILPSDGGVVTIQGAGAIYKLFPIQNGMLVFAQNGIWFITGSQGIGFTANDYTITKISAVRAISQNSFVDFNGLPIFWNEEGIYTVASAQQGLGLTVTPITIGTIKSFYDQIPLDSKRFAKCAYNPITYVAQWIYRSTQESSVTDRYQYDSILCLNTFLNCFYKYSLPAGTPYIHGIKYIASPGGSNAPAPTFKYVTSVLNGNSYSFTFSEERRTDYLDWFSFDGIGQTYSSFFTAGFNLAGQGLRKFQSIYLEVYSRYLQPSAYIVQSIWDFANNRNSGRYSSKQKTVLNEDNFGMVYRRHKIRGQGMAAQLKISSVDNNPFDIMGWTVWNIQSMSA